MRTNSTQIVLEVGIAYKINKYLLFFALMFFIKCMDDKTINRHKENGNLGISAWVNHDSITFSLLEEQHFENISASSSDTLIRVIHNKSFDNVLFFFFEKSAPSIFLTTKVIPHQYYNPLVRSDNVIMKYNYCKKEISNENWVYLMDTFRMDKIKENRYEFSSDIDGEYVYIEIKTFYKHIKVVEKPPYSENIQNIIGFFKNVSLCD